MTTWCDVETTTPWRQIEQELVKPHNLADVLFCGAKPGLARRMFGSIISNSLQVHSDVQKHIDCNIKICNRSPIWYNYNLLQNSGPYFNHGVCSVQNLYDQSRLFSFQKLGGSYSLPGTSWFLYLQLRSAIRANGVPWDSPLPSHNLNT